jgi:hypothetical protein
MSMSFNGVTGITFPDSTTQATAAVQSIGVAQTWQNMIGSRAAGTNYTNSTGRPIMVAITTSTGNSSASFYINGNLVATQGGDLNNTNTFTFIIPNGDNYRISNSVSQWWELR